MSEQTQMQTPTQTLTPSVTFLRIDDRLIHGQVIVGWLPVVDPTLIQVVNEKIVRDPLRQEMMSLSVPPSVELQFATPDEVSSTRLPFATLVLVASPKDAWSCTQRGIIPATFNVGGMHSRPGKTEIYEALHVNDEDRDYFQRLFQAGFQPVFQPTPQNDPEFLQDILE